VAAGTRIVNASNWALKEEAMAREVPVESNRDKLRRLQRQDALGLFAAHKLQIPSKERLEQTDQDHPQGLVQATHAGEEAIVEYMDVRNRWLLARVSWETYQAIPQSA
jgi:hypothetical protein